MSPDFGGFLNCILPPVNGVSAFITDGVGISLKSVVVVEFIFTKMSCFVKKGNLKKNSLVLLSPIKVNLFMNNPLVNKKRPYVWSINKKKTTVCRP